MCTSHETLEIFSMNMVEYRMDNYCECGSPWIKEDSCERCNKKIEPKRLESLTYEEVIPTLENSDVIHAKGVGGSVSFDGNMITIRHKGLLSLGTVGLVPEKQIPVEKLTSIQFKPAGLINGYIQFATGAGEASGGIFDATKDENTLMFEKKHQKHIEVIKSAVEQAMRKSNTKTVGSTLSAADELKKYHELFQAGILSEEEFLQQKRKILGT
jgi:hypothetical protein